MGQINISKKGKYVNLGNSLLNQFLINSDSPIMYKGGNNTENLGNFNWWQSITQEMNT